MTPTRTKADLRRLAVEIRTTDLGLTDRQPLDPYQLAEEHGVDVYSLPDLAAAGCPQETIDFFTSVEPDAWSAALVPAGTGQFIIENHAHTPPRRRSNLGHEMAHLLLEHEFDRILFSDGKGCRDPANRPLEREAAELAGELLLPIAAARPAAMKGCPEQQLADEYGVSVEIARWRMNVSGGHTIAQRAAKRRRRDGR